MKDKKAHKNLILEDIQFPIFTITHSYIRIWEDMGVVYIQTPSGEYILDNKNVQGKTLAERRLHINADNLYIPRALYSNITQLIKSNKTKFIDTDGNIFNYKKRVYVPLIYYKVKGVTELEDESGCVLELKDIDYPVKLNCIDAYDVKYVGLLHTDNGYILYDLTDKVPKDSKRKI